MRPFDDYETASPCVCYPLGGSGVVISGVISRVTIVITWIRGLITPRIATHEPPSKYCLRFRSLVVAARFVFEVRIKVCNRSAVLVMITLNPKP